MKNLVLLVKTHGADRPYVQRLLESLRAHNVENIPIYLVAPESELSEFMSFSDSSIQVLSDEDVAGRYLVTHGAHGLSAGYINQEIVKLAFGETKVARNFFCVDSDAVFIRPFGELDFLRSPEEPYSVLVQDKELEVEPRYYREHWRSREQSIRRIMELVGLDDPVMRTCHGHQVFSSRVLASLREEFLEPRKWTYADAVLEVPYEFSWYNMWLQKSGAIPIHAIEPLVKVFHNEDQHIDYLVRGITLADIARGYLAVVINSNFSRDLGVINVEADKFDLVGSYLSYGELMRVARAKGSDSFRRRLLQRRGRGES